jgi:hypothetical protein
VKRRRPEPKLFNTLRANAYLGEVIPPRSIVRLTAPWGEDQGRLFRIGYYRRQDGLNCVWLVNAEGEYEQTTEQESIKRDFEVPKVSDETDWHGFDRQTLGPVSDSELIRLEEA